MLRWFKSQENSVKVFLVLTVINVLVAGVSAYGRYSNRQKLAEITRIMAVIQEELEARECVQGGSI